MSAFANGGTAAGAAVGTIVPGVGTAIGGAVGTIAGDVVGLLGGSNKDPIRYQREQALFQRIVQGVSVGGVSADANAAAKTLYENATGADGDNNPAVTRGYAQGFIAQLQQQGIQVNDNGVIQTNSAVANAGIAFANAFAVTPGSPLLGYLAIGLGVLGVGAAVYFVARGG